MSFSVLVLTFCIALFSLPAFAASTADEYDKGSASQYILIDDSTATIATVTEEVYDSATDTDIANKTAISIWKLCIIIIELIILGILIYAIISDLKVIRWFEEKKKSRLWPYQSSLYHTVRMGDFHESDRLHGAHEDSGDSVE